MAYLELSREAYEDVLNAAGNRRGAVALKLSDVGVWDATATKAEAPPEAVPEPDEAAEAAPATEATD